MTGFVAVESLINDARRENAFGLMMSLNMLIDLAKHSTPPGPTSSAGAASPGFREMDVIPLGGPANAAVAYK